MSRAAYPIMRASGPGSWFRFRNVNREIVPTPQRRDMFQGKRRVFESNNRTMKMHERFYKPIDIIKTIKEEKDDVFAR